MGIKRKGGKKGGKAKRPARVEAINAFLSSIGAGRWSL